MDLVLPHLDPLGPKSLKLQVVWQLPELHPLLVPLVEVVEAIRRGL